LPITPETLRARLRVLLPSNLLELARMLKAFVRLRGFESVEALVFALLHYAGGDASFKDTAACLSAAGSPISHSALQERLVDAEAFLGHLLSHVLAGGVETSAGPGQGRVLRIVDATSVSGPGATGTDLRVHALFDEQSKRLVAVKVTGDHVGESSALHPLGCESVKLGDRAYPTVKNIVSLEDRGVEYLIRLIPETLPVYDADGRRRDLRECECDALVGRPFEETAWLHVKSPAGKRPLRGARPVVRRVAVRIVAVRVTPETVIWLVTNLPADKVDAEGLSQLYRVRWQVELMFKRMKSLGGLGRMKSRNGPSARAWLLAKLLLFALAQAHVRPAGPKGETERSLHSAWSRTRVALAAVILAITGYAVLALASCETAMLRLRNTPSRRPMQRPSRALQHSLGLWQAA